MIANFRRIGNGRLVQAAILLLLIASAAPAGAVLAPKGPPVAVFLAQKSVQGPAELFSADATGQDVVCLSGTPAKGYVYNFRWSPNRKLVAFIADRDTQGVLELYVVPAEGGEVVKVSGLLVPGGNVVPYNYSWSPNSTRVAYLADQDTNGFDELYVSTADGKSNTKVSAPLVPGGHVDDYAWSPSGARIAYHANQEDVGKYRLYFATPDAKKRGPLTKDLAPEDQAGMLQWSPNGSRIAYRTSGINGIGAGLYVASADGKKTFQVSGPIVQFGAIYDFQWSPSGSRIAYVASKENPSLRDLWVATPDGKKDVKISGPMVFDGDVDGFAWEPGGKRIAYRADQITNNLWEVFVATPDGKHSERVSGAEVGAQPGIPAFRWSPKGDLLAYPSPGGPGQGLKVVTVARADGSGTTTVSSPLAPGEAGILGIPPVWSLDGSRVAYLTYDNGGERRAVYAGAPDGSLCEKVTPPLPPGGAVWETILWSKALKGFAFQADPELKDQHGLFVAKPGTPGALKLSGAVASGAYGVLESWFEVR